MLNLFEKDMSNEPPVIAGKITADDLRTIRAVEVFNSLFKVEYMVLFGGIHCRLNTGKVMPFYVLWKQINEYRTHRNMDRFRKIVSSITSKNSKTVSEAIKQYISFMGFDWKISNLLYEKFTLYRGAKNSTYPDKDVTRRISDHNLTTGLHKSFNSCVHDMVKFTDRFGRLLEVDTEIYLRLGLPPIHLISAFNGILEEMFFEIGRSMHGDSYTTISGMFHVKRNLSDSSPLSFNCQQTDTFKNIFRKYAYELNNIIRIYNNVISKIDVDCSQLLKTKYKTPDVLDYNSDLEDIDTKKTYDDSVTYLVKSIAKISSVFKNELTLDELMDWCLSANRQLCDSLHLNGADQNDYTRKKDIYDDLKAYVMLKTYNGITNKQNSVNPNVALKASVF